MFLASCARYSAHQSAAIIRTIQKNKFGSGTGANHFKSVLVSCTFNIIPIGTVHFCLFQMEVRGRIWIGADLDIQLNIASTLCFNAAPLHRWGGGLRSGFYFATYIIRSKGYLMGTVWIWSRMSNWMSDTDRFLALNTWTSRQTQKEHHFQVLFSLFQYMNKLGKWYHFISLKHYHNQHVVVL
jgi:hypothetical protein